MRHHRTVWLALSVLLAIANEARALDRITGREFATRSEVIAPHGDGGDQPAAGDPDRPRHPEGGRHRRRRGHRRRTPRWASWSRRARASAATSSPSCGIGKTKKLYGLNASGRSPKSLTLDVSASRRSSTHIPPHGPLPVTVPGCVDGWFELHERFGRLPMKRVLAPAIRYAREGFPVTELIAYYWARSARALDDAASIPAFATTYLVDGRAPRERRGVPQSGPGAHLRD